MSQIKDNPVDDDFSLPNGDTESRHKFEFTDVELIALQSSLTYTSLRDILPTNPSSSSSIMSPTNNSSWHEIPIKNPLVKHAALAYLQPMSTQPELDGRSFFSKLKDKCCGCFGTEGGCFGYFKEVVVQVIQVACSERKWRENYDDDDDNVNYYYDDDDDEDDEDEEDEDHKSRLN